MTNRIKTHVKSPYIGLFQYENSGPASIHSNPNNTLLPTDMPYIGTFKHNFPWFLPSYLRKNYTTQETATQTSPKATNGSTKTNDQCTQTETDLNTYVIVKYMDK
tara:strand:- start:236 stop:550 length:315 start_codon:yes stop_codon:yes gene_type:complete